MAKVRCARCGKSAEGLERAPLPGVDGEQVLARSCAGCWKEWRGAQVILMNENQLSPGDPEHYRKLIGEMRSFLGLAEAGGSDS